MPSFRCASCGKVIVWGFIPGYGYGFIHKTGPKTLCATPKFPKPKEE